MSDHSQPRLQPYQGARVRCPRCGSDSMEHLRFVFPMALAWNPETGFFELDADYSDLFPDTTEHPDYVYCPGCDCRFNPFEEEG